MWSEGRRELALVSPGSPFELVSENVAGMPRKVFKHAPPTIGHLYKRARTLRGEEFLVSSSGRFRYEEVFWRAARLSETLANHYGIGAETRVAIVLGCAPEWVIAFIATTALGATAAMIHRNGLQSVVVRAVRAADCAVVLCDDVVSTLLREEGIEAPTIDVMQFGSKWQEEYDRQVGADWDRDFIESVQGNREVCSDQIALIAYTSGSTGDPKGVQLTHRSVICGLLNMLLGAAISAVRRESGGSGSQGASPVSVIVSPLSHISGYANVLLAIYLGAKIVIPQTSDSDSILSCIRTERATSLIGVTPDMLVELLDNVRASESGDTLRGVIVHGTTMHPKLREKLRSRWPLVRMNAACYVLRYLRRSAFRLPALVRGF